MVFFESLAFLENVWRAISAAPSITSILEHRLACTRARTSQVPEMYVLNFFIFIFEKKGRAVARNKVTA